MINTQFPNKIGLITREKSYTYQELFEKINQYSKLFKNNSYTKIAIHSENRAEWLFAFYAGWQNNCVVVPIDFIASVDDVSYIINDCEPELVFISSETEDKFKKVKTKLKYVPQVLNFNDIKLEENKNEFVWNVPQDEEQTAVIIYTSGTTGSPKGVMLTFKNLLANIAAVSEDVKIFNKERQVLLLLPLHHIFPLAGSMAAPLALVEQL
ncbi:MAG: hypothetical protein C0597_10475 [Marinilabiliales bacterium]|nr:MAG: hypothetical protein C0597_10475 [Marinilabiliales bacterium]